MQPIHPSEDQGFTLIELMIVIAVIGVLAAIAIPNFVRFQARSKQAEAKLNLKSAFSAQRSQFQEKDRYLTLVRTLGFTPERGNRYWYQLGTAASVETRSAVTALTSLTDESISVDTFKYPTMAPQPAPVAAFAGANWSTSGVAPAGIGVTGVCPNCSFLAQATGNIDNEAVGIDQWVIASLDFSVTPNCGESVDIQAPAGQPFNFYNDVVCP